MSYKRTLIFLVVFVALAAFLYFYEIRGGEARREAEQKAELLFSFDSENIVRLTLRRPEQVIVAEKRDDTWEIKEPVNTPAEKGMIEQILKSLADLRFERDLGAQADLSQFGLLEPEIEVNIDDAHGRIAGLLLGFSTPVGGNLYVKNSDKDQIFTAKNTVKTRIDKTLFDLRDKTIFQFEVPDVTALTITRDGRDISFTKDMDGGWVLQQQALDIDRNEITSLLDSVKYATVREFVEEEAEDFEKYDLLNPPALLTIQTEDATRTLAFGKMPETDSKSIFVRRNAGPQVLKLDLDIFDQLTTDVNEWRDKQLVKADRTAIAKLHMESPAGKMTLERGEEEPDEWRLIEPERVLADEDTVDRLLADLQDAKVARFLEPEEMEKVRAGLKDPLIAVHILEKNEESAFLLNLFEGEGDTEAYAGTGEGQELFGIDPQLLEKLTIAPDRIKDKSVLRFNTADIKKIEIAREGNSYSIEQEGVNWDVPSGLDMQSYEVDQLLWDLRELKYNAVQSVGKDNEKYGFDSPSLIITLLHAGEKDPVKLTVGNKTDEPDSYYLLGSDEKQALVVEDALISRWLERF